jgi:hypothetical protein
MSDFPLWSAGSGVEVITTPDTSQSGGKELTKSGTANTKSSYTELNASTSRAYGGFIVQLCSNGTANEVTTALVDIAFGTTVVVSNLLCFGDYIPYNSNTIYFPISIPSGTQIQARLQQRLSQGTPSIQMWGVPFDPLMPSPMGRVTTYGASTADSGGVEVDCGVTPNSKVRTQIVASTTNPMKHMIVCIGDVGVTARGLSKFLFDIEIGAGDEIIYQGLTLRGNTFEELFPTHFQFPVNLPAGTEININAQSSGNADNQSREFDVVILGID